MSNQTKTLVIEACPNCHTVHSYVVANGKILDDGNPVDSVKCQAIVGHHKPTPEEIEQYKKQNPPTAKVPELMPTPCGYEIKINEKTNLFVIRLYTYREKQEYYKLTGVFAPQNVTPGQAPHISLTVGPEIMDFVLNKGVVQSPEPLKTPTDLANTTIDASVLELLGNEINLFNAPPLALSSALRQQSSRVMLSRS